MAMNYLNSKGIKTYLKGKGLRTSAGYLEALDREVQIIMDKHSRMTVADKRVTVQAIDITLPDTIASLVKGVRR